ncbi:hypothetical protein SMU40_02860 [Streptococcus mutans 15VF2]|nr:hypothetical protein SMU22_01702 [Streptococcus mutans 4SM1]EMB74866.1 hypothetical protein SMU40_02860 [Streptococcus mutans 15VF2]EMC50824.1 hypothetical protein SMU103_00620 [Streptococcus mutans SA38]
MEAAKLASSTQRLIMSFSKHITILLNLSSSALFLQLTIFLV